jgi:hypothetical protein
MVGRMRFLAISLACAAGLAACESTRALVSTPAATPWPAGSYLKVSLFLAIPLTRIGPTPRPNIVMIQASDSLTATDALPREVASASTIALLAGGAALPLAPRFGLPRPSPALPEPEPVLVTNPPNVVPLLPRADGTQEYHFLIDQRVVRTFPATISIIP